MEEEEKAQEQDSMSNNLRQNVLSSNENESTGADNAQIMEPQGPVKQTGANGRRVFHIIGDLVCGVLVLGLILITFFLVQSKLTGGTPQLAGYQVYITLSGSMMPAFDTGSVILVKSIRTEEIKEGDIITFRGKSIDTLITTHRVVHVNKDIDGINFTTKGDANNVSDPNPVLARRVVGKVYGHVPYVGYIMGFAKTRTGLITLVFVPGILIILYEVFSLISQFKKAKKHKQFTKNVQA